MGPAPTEADQQEPLLEEEQDFGDVQLPEPTREEDVNPETPEGEFGLPGEPAAGGPAGQPPMGEPLPGGPARPPADVPPLPDVFPGEPDGGDDPLADPLGNPLTNPIDSLPGLDPLGPGTQRRPSLPAYDAAERDVVRQAVDHSDAPLTLAIPAAPEPMSAPPADEAREAYANQDRLVLPAGPAAIAVDGSAEVGQPAIAQASEQVALPQTSLAEPPRARIALPGMSSQDAEAASMPRMPGGKAANLLDEDAPPPLPEFLRQAAWQQALPSAAEARVAPPRPVAAQNDGSAASAANSAVQDRQVRPAAAVAPTGIQLINPAAALVTPPQQEPLQQAIYYEATDTVQRPLPRPSRR